MLPDLSLVIVVPVLVGLVVVVIGLSMAAHRARRRRQWAHTPGPSRVAAQHDGWRGRHERLRPKAAFEAADGREVTATLSYGVNLGIYPTGGAVDVWYDPADPQRVQANVLGTGCLPVFLLLLGVAIGVVGVLVATGF